MLVKDATRQLARIITIDAIKPIPKADRLELAVIGGWESIVTKGMYNAGSKVLYLEVDAALRYDSPILANFDKKRLKNIIDNDIEYVVIKTMKLRSELSQGLILNIGENNELNKLTPGTDVSNKLGVQKYVSPEEAKLYYQAELEAKAIEENNKISPLRKAIWKLCAKLKRGIVTDGLLPFPSHVHKSEQPRAQNIGNILVASHHTDETYEYSTKLNGESITYYTDIDAAGTIRIAQRNYALRLEDVPYTRKEALRVYAAALIHYVTRKLAGAQMTFPSYKTAFKATDTPSVQLFVDLNIAARLKALNENLSSGLPVFIDLHNCKISIQGECVGPDFHGNAERSPKNDFYAYTVYSNGSKALKPALARQVVEYLGLNYVPVLETHAKLPATVKELMVLADGKGTFDPSIVREGIVGKCNSSDVTFKAVSNKWLMRNDAADTEEAA